MREGGRAPRLVAAVVAVLVAATLGACARIPTSGPVVDGPVGEDYFRPLPRGPGAGATPQDVVSGFLGASLGADEDYEVARTYLQPQTAGDWRPSEQTVVYSGQARITFVGAGSDVPGDAPGEVDEVTARIAVDVIGVVDSDGRYAQRAPGTASTVELTLRRGGPDRQWRISATPDLALLSQNDFRFTFRPYRLYFLDPTLNFLVPDQRWFPESDATTTRLVAELLDGPAPWLAPAVDTAFPAGTQLAAPQAVKLEDSEATVPMTSPARSANGAQRRLMRQQLLATLRSRLGVTDVRVSVDGAELSLDDEGSAQAPRRDPRVAREAVLLRGEAIVRLDGAKTSPVPDLPSLEGLGPSHPAVGYGGATFAVLAQERSQLRTLAPGAEAVSEPLVVAADLTAPSFDWRGWVWTSPAASTGTVLAALPESGAVQVEAPWLAGRQVGSLRVSRDGTRVVVTSTGADGSAHVEVAGVVRASNFRPVRLTDPLPLAVGSDLVLADEAVWVDENRVAFLGRRSGDEATRVLRVDIGGFAPDATAPVPDAVTLAAARGDRSLLVATSDGRLLVQQGAGWAEVPGGEGTRQPAFEG